MELFWRILAGAALCLAVAVLVAAVRGMVFTPIRRFSGAETLAVIRASGSAEGLESALRGVEWLRECGRAQVEIVIADCGMDREAQRRAEVLALKTGAKIVGRENFDIGSV